MRQLKALLLAALALVFVAGVGTGAWIGSLAAATKGPPTLDRRVRDFTDVYDLSPTQLRQLREILYDFDRDKQRIQQPTPEQAREMRTLEAESRGRIRQILTAEQRADYDRRVASR
jgi:Spy/CpxP family protein refolding chaperone